MTKKFAEHQAKMSKEAIARSDQKTQVLREEMALTLPTAEAGGFTFNEAKYRGLLGEALPVAIRAETEYRRLLAEALRLMEMDEAAMSEEQGRLLDMLGILIEEYEDRVYPLPKTEPHKMLD
jgi:hypothetical protein